MCIKLKCIHFHFFKWLLILTFLIYKSCQVRDNFVKTEFWNRKNKCFSNMHGTIIKNWEKKTFGEHLTGITGCGMELTGRGASRGGWVWLQVLLSSLRQVCLGRGSTVSSLPANLDKACDHPASDLVCISTSLYHTGHILCPQAIKRKVTVEKKSFRNKKGSK